MKNKSQKTDETKTFKVRYKDGKTEIIKGESPLLIGNDYVTICVPCSHVQHVFKDFDSIVELDKDQIYRLDNPLFLFDKEKHKLEERVKYYLEENKILNRGISFYRTRNLWQRIFNHKHKSNYIPDYDKNI